MKEFFFISGLPRSGSTLLSAILRQNPEFYADISSPVQGLVASTINVITGSESNHLIDEDLDPLYQGQYEIQLVPNVVNITYGRDVGYKIEQEVFDAATHAISATEIRKKMGV